MSWERNGGRDALVRFPKRAAKHSREDVLEQDGQDVELCRRSWARNGDSMDPTAQVVAETGDAGEGA